MTLFVILFAVGLLFLIVTAILGGLADFGGHDIDIGGGDLDTGGHLGAGAHFSPLSPTLISFFFTVFGGVGALTMSLWDMQFRYSLLIGLVSALGSATVVYLALCKVFESTQGGVEVNVAELAGREAEVITSIPKGGTGEIAFITAGGRINGPARSLDGKAIHHNTTVQIVKVVGNAYIVREVELKLVEPPVENNETAKEESNRSGS